MIDLGRSIPIFRDTIDRMVIGEPESLLIVEFHGFEDQPLLTQLARLETLMGDLGFPNSVVRATEPDFQAQIAEVREAGLNIMMSMKGDGKPISFIEDAAVPLEDLADYTERLNAVFERHGARGTWYAHASVGCLHVRPVLNMKDPNDVTRMRSIAEECFDLVRQYKGSHSGEHGDGIARSEFNEPMFGARIARAFEAVKDAFDPDGLLNPGPDRPCATLRRPVAVPLRARLSADRGVLASARLVGLSGAAGRPAWAPSRCATTTAIAVSSTPARCVRAIGRRATSSILFVAEPIRFGSPSPASSTRRRWPRATLRRR